MTRWTALLPLLLLTACVGRPPADPLPEDPAPMDPATPDPADPLSAAATCTSNTTWRNGDRGSTVMHPGCACITCHDSSRGAPLFGFAGTVFPSGHEPDDCNGANSATGARVVITDATGKQISVGVNSAGNFYSSATLRTPFTAKLVMGAKERVMTASQTDGDCNSCHTQDGLQGAPGRITLPE